MATARPLVVVAVVAVAVQALAPTPAQKGEATAAAALGSCFKRVGLRELACFQGQIGACAPGDASIAGALAKLERKVVARCPDAATVQAAGYGAAATPAGLV